MADLRKVKTDGEIEFEMICKKHKMRETRVKQSGKEFQKRSTHDETELSDFMNFKRRGITYSDFLDKAKPDIVERLNQEIREKKERERKRKVEEKKNEKDGQWNYDGESGEYYWTGDTEQDHGETFVNSPPTEEEKQIQREAEQQEYDWFVEESANKQKEKRKQKDMENKKAMATPIDPLPERELCAYEKLREILFKNWKKQ